MSDDEIVHFDIEITGDWITGKTKNVTTGFVTSWSKLTDAAYIRKFWFAEPPIHYLKSQYGLSIDWKTSEALGNLFETDWINFCYLFSAFDNKEDAIKLFIGPIAQIAKETGTRALDVIADKRKLIRLVNDTLTFNQKKAMLPELSEDYDIVRTRHVFAEVHDYEIFDALKAVIEANPEQWEKAQKQTNLKNWFVGQIMKKYQGKIDASRVKVILETM
jgi:hypothetical protein